MADSTPHTDPDMVLATQALKRAAKRAKELAARTRTNYVIMRDGKLVCEVPELEEQHDEASRQNVEKPK